MAFLKGNLLAANTRREDAGFFLIDAFSADVLTSSIRLLMHGMNLPQSLPLRNRIAPLRMRPCSRRRSHFPRADFIHQFVIDRRKIVFAESGNGVGSVKKQRKVTMIKKLLGVAVVAAMTSAVVPAQAAKMGGGCSGANLAKTESTIEAMADSEAKFAAEKEIAAANDALLNGKMGACGMHLDKAMHGTMAK